MSEYSYELPDAQAFLYTLRRYLDKTGDSTVAVLLMNSVCTITSSGTYSGRRWDAHSATLRITVSIDLIPKFTDNVLEILLAAVNTVFPQDAGFDIVDFGV